MNLTRRSISRLRKEAESILKENPNAAPVLKTASVQELLYELQVYETELEIQNEDLRKAHFDLVETRDRFAELYDFAPTGYFTLDAETRIVEANLTAVKLFGLNRSEIKDGRSKFSDLVAPQSQDDWFRFRRRMFIGDEKQSCELDCGSVKGPFFRCQIESVVVRGDGHSGDRSLIALIDITERSKAREALLHANKVIGAIATHDGLVIADASGKITDMNQTALALFGFGSKEDMVRVMSGDAKVMDLSGPDGKELSIGQWPLTRVCAGESFAEQEYSVYVRATKRRWYAVFSGAPVRDENGKIENAVLTIRDISDRKQAEWAEQAARELADHKMEEALEMKNRLEAVMQVLPVGVALLDTQGGTISANRAFDEIWGNPRPAARTIGDYIQDKASWADTGKTVLPDEWASSRALRNGKTVTGQIIRIVGFDGVQRVVLDNAAPILDTFGEVAGCAVTIQDLTRQMENERAVRESEERLRLAQVSAKVGIWDWDLAKDSVAFTTELNLIYGLAPGTIKTYRDWRGFADPDDMENAERERDKAIAKREPFNLEFRIHHSSGEVRWVNAKGGAMYDNAGKPVRVLGVVIDITERKRMEALLRESEERYRLLVQKAPAGIFEVGFPDGKLSDVNDAMCNILGYSRAEISSITAFDLLDDEGKIRFATRIRQGQSGEKPGESVEYRVRTKDGHFLWALLNTTFKWNNGKIVGAMVVAHDITERKQMEEKLQTTLRRFYLILSNMHFGILLVTNENRVEFVNQSFCDMFGLKDLPDDLMKLSANEMIDKIRPCYTKPDEAVARIGELVLLGQTASGEDVGMAGGQSLLRDFIPIRIGDKLYGRLWVHTDITERKKAEETLRDSQQRLSAILNSASESIWLMNLKGEILAANEIAAKRMGIALEEVVEKNCFDLLPPDVVKTRMAKIEEMAATKNPVRFEDERAGIIFDHTFYPVKDGQGKITGVAIFSRDITGRKKVEKELRESEERFKAIAETTPVGIGVVGLSEATFLYVNPAYVKSFGYTESEILGKGVQDIYWSIEDRDRVLGILKKEGNVAEYEVKLKRKDGAPFWGLSSVRPITYGGRPALLGAFVDITERKRAEDEVKRHATELKAANEELVRFNRAMVDRELRMIELKKQVNELCGKLGMEPMYKVGKEQ